MAHSVDTDQSPRSAPSDLGLHCLLPSVCLSVRMLRENTVTISTDKIFTDNNQKSKVLQRM